MGRRRLTTAQAIVEFLHNQYLEFDGQQTRFVRGFFTLYGHGNVLGLGQALQQVENAEQAEIPLLEKGFYIFRSRKGELIEFVVTR